MEAVIATQNQNFISIPQSGNENVANLQGEWVALNVAYIEKEIANQSSQSSDVVCVSLESVSRIDTAGALLIRKYFPQAELKLSPRQQKLFEFLPEKIVESPSQETKNLKSAVTDLGKNVSEAVKFLYDLIAFTGEVAAKLGGCLLHPGRFRFASIVRHIDETGFRALPIIGLLGFLMSMVVSYQAAMQLQKFGASIFTIDLTVISLLREMGVLITAIMVAGRSGSAFAAEIGVMKLR